MALRAAARHRRGARSGSRRSRGRLRVFVGVSGRSSSSPRDDIRVRASAASPTRSASTECCPGRSAGSGGARSSRPRRSRRSSSRGRRPDRHHSGIDDEVAFLAALFSFGVLLAFGAAQLAVIRLRFTSPELERPYRVPGTFASVARTSRSPRSSGLSDRRRLGDRHDHAPRSRYAGPIWLATGLVVHGLVRRHRGEGRLEGVISPDEQAEPRWSPRCRRSSCREARADRRGDDRDRHQARPGARLRRRGAPRRAHAAVQEPRRPRRSGRGGAGGRLARGGAPARRGPWRRRPRQHCPGSLDRRGDRAAGDRAERSTSSCSARRRGWRRQSRFFSPIVEHVLRNAPCEVLVVAFPEHVLEEDG